MSREIFDRMGMRKFADPALELRFRHQYQAGALSMCRMSAIGAAIAIWVFIVLDHLVPLDTGAVINQMLRLIPLIAAHGVIYLTSERRGIPAGSNPWVATSWVWVNLGFFLLLASTASAQSETAYFRLIVLFCLITTCASLMLRTHLIATAMTMLALTVWVAGKYWPLFQGNPLIWMRGIGYMAACLVMGFSIWVGIFLHERRYFEVMATALAKSEQAANAFDAKLRLLTNLSHELRQPLSANSTYVELLATKAQINADQETRAWLSKIIESTRSISTQLTGLIAAAQAHNIKSKADLELVDLHELLGQVADHFELACAQRDVDLVIHQPEAHTMLALSNRMICFQMVKATIERALDNFGRSGAGQRKWLLVRALLHGDHITLRIIDNGRFPVADLFDPKTVGRLALAMAREGAQKLGHTLQEYEGREGGTCIRIQMHSAGLPTGERAAALSLPHRLDQRGSTTNNLDGAYVMLIEDDMHCRYSLGECMRQRGMRVDTAANAQEALQLIEDAEIPFDLVITDYRLTGTTNGLGLLRQIRKALGYEIPGIVTSGDVSVALKVRALPDHTQFHAKPIKFEGLLGLIGRMVRRQASGLAG